MVGFKKCGHPSGGGGGGADFFWNSPINLVFIGLSILFHHIKNFQLLNRLLCGHNCFLFNSYTNECVFYTVLVFRCSSSAVPDVMINTEVWVPSTHSYQSDNWIDSQLVHGAGTISSHGRYQLTVALYLSLRDAWKIHDFHRIWTCDLAIPVGRSNQLSYEATDVGSWSCVGSNVPVRRESTMKWYMNWIIYELWIWNQVKLWSSRLWKQFLQLFREAWKIHEFNRIWSLCHLTHKWPAPNVSGFIAQLVRASHWYREVTGSNPVEVMNFSGFCTQLQ